MWIEIALGSLVLHTQWMSPGGCESDDHADVAVSPIDQVQIGVAELIVAWSIRSAAAAALSTGCNLLAVRCDRTARLAPRNRHDRRSRSRRTRFRRQQREVSRGHPARRSQPAGDCRETRGVRWLVSVVHHVLHGAAEEIRANRVKTEDSARMIVATVQPMLAAAPTETHRADGAPGAS